MACQLYLDANYWKDPKTEGADLTPLGAIGMGTLLCAMPPPPALFPRFRTGAGLGDLLPSTSFSSSKETRQIGTNWGLK